MDRLETAWEGALAIGGATGVAIVDFQQRRVLGSLDRGSGLDMDKVAYGDSDVMRAKLSSWSSWATPRTALRTS
ncbi:hypothetical protein [Streptomyces sp. NPDC001205]